MGGRRWRAAWAAGAVALLALAGAGCGSAPTRCLDCGGFPPPPWRKHDTPANTIAALQGAYEAEDVAYFTGLLTADFRYRFSAASDSGLVALYGDNWGKDDEAASARHLLAGFTNAQGTYVPAASSISLALVNAQVFGDPAHSDSLRFYAYCPVTSVDLVVDVPDSTGPISYEVRAPQAFFLVRGDAAVLDAGQPADSLHWYIRRWDDENASQGADTAPPRVATTWGRIKARYRG